MNDNTFQLKTSKLNKKKLIYIDDLMIKEEDVNEQLNEIYSSGVYCDKDTFELNKNNMLRKLNSIISNNLNGIDNKIVIDKKCDHIDAYILSINLQDSVKNIKFNIRFMPCKVVGNIKNRKYIIELINEYYSYNKFAPTFHYPTKYYCELILLDSSEHIIHEKEALINNIFLDMNKFIDSYNKEFPILNKFNILEKVYCPEDSIAKLLRSKKNDYHYELKFSVEPKSTSFMSDIRLLYIMIIDKKFNDIVVPKKNDYIMDRFIVIKTPILDFEKIFEAIGELIKLGNIRDEDYVYKLTMKDKNEYR